MMKEATLRGLYLLLCSFVSVGYGEEDWFAQGQRSLEDKLDVRTNENVAKNVILFLGDGMGVSTVTSSRIFHGQRSGGHGEEAELSFEKFPHTGMLKTYNVDAQVPDSAGTATALLAGIKTRFGVLGVDHNVRQMDCGSLPGHEVDGILHWSQQEGKSTGIVTTTRLTHATPAAAYAHSPWRFWEIDSDLPPPARGFCEDLALQLIARNPDINVILGGGRAYFMSNTSVDPEYPDIRGIRADGRDLLKEWQETKRAQGAAHSYVWNDQQFRDVEPGNTDYLMGLFEPDHMHYDLDRPYDGAGEPSLAEMVDKAVKVLEKNPKGYFLLVEGGRIDHAHHGGNAARAIHDTVAMATAVTSAVQATDTLDTLIIVTADHSHTLTIGGYPTRGNDILGLLDPQAVKIQPPLDGLPVTTLMYANGPGLVNRSLLKGADTASPDFLQPVAYPTSKETHGGEDVTVYARGPMSHLFSGVHEQHYVAHVMAYASCVGANRRHCYHDNHGRFEKSLSGGVRLNDGFRDMGFVLFILIVLL